jgi:starch synthase
MHRALGRLGWGNVLHNDLFDRWAARGVRRCAGPLDIVHACNSHALRVGVAARKRGARLVFDHGAANRAFETDLLAGEYAKFGLPPLGRANDLQTRKQDRELAGADFVVCPSEYSKRSFVERGFEEERVFVCPYGVDAAKFAPPGGRSLAGERETFRVLYIGGDHVRKGVPYLIEAMDRVAAPNVELVLVAPNAGVIQPLIRAAKCPIRVIDFLSHAELGKLIHSCSAFCLPSISDGFGMVVYEAMAGGLPAIVSENVGAPVRDGVDGFVVPIRDADALADRLRSLRDDPALRQRLGDAAIERATEQTWDAYFGFVRAAYDAMLAV